MESVAGRMLMQGSPAMSFMMDTVLRPPPQAWFIKLACI